MGWTAGVAGTRGTVAQHLTADVPRVSPHDRADLVVSRLLGHHFATVHVLAVLDGDHLAGLVSIESLLAAPAEAVMSELMDPTRPPWSSTPDRSPRSGGPCSVEEPSWPWSTAAPASRAS